MTWKFEKGHEIHLHTMEVKAINFIKVAFHAFLSVFLQLQLKKSYVGNSRC